MKNKLLIGLVILTALVIIGLLNPMPTDTQILAATPMVSTESQSRTEERCVPASQEQISAITAFLEADLALGSGAAVRSKEFEQVWIIAGLIDGLGQPASPAVWAVSGEQASPGIVLSVDALAKEFSSAPDAETTRANITLGSDGVAEAISCAK